MKTNYKGFTIESASLDIIYAGNTTKTKHYVVSKEINGNQCFLEGLTAFDSLKQAMQAIDKIVA